MRRLLLVAAVLIPALAGAQTLPEQLGDTAPSEITEYLDQQIRKASRRVDALETITSIDSTIVTWVLISSQDVAGVSTVTFSGLQAYSNTVSSPTFRVVFQAKSSAASYFHLLLNGDSNQNYGAGGFTFNRGATRSDGAASAFSAPLTRGDVTVISGDSMHCDYVDVTTSFAAAVGRTKAVSLCQYANTGNTYATQDVTLGDSAYLGSVAISTIQFVTSSANHNTRTDRNGNITGHFELYIASQVAVGRGPKGDTGATGATGAAGTNGADGADGAGIELMAVSSTTCDIWTVRGAAVPADDTIPQINEGWQILAATATPSSAASFIYLTANIDLSEPSNVCNNGVMTFFQDATANAICSEPFDAGSTSNTPRLVKGYCRVAAGSTNQRVYSVRVGCDTANGIGVNLNTAGSARLYGGTTCSEFVVQEKSQ